MREMRHVHMSLLEKTVLVSLVLMCLISYLDALTGQEVGREDQLRTAQLQARQELMALRTHPN